VEGGGGGLTVSGVSRNRGSFVKCVAIQKRLGISGLGVDGRIILNGSVGNRVEGCELDSSGSIEAAGGLW
jgi:hypothetical protein